MVRPSLVLLILLASALALPAASATADLEAPDATASSSGWDCAVSVGAKIGAACYDADRNYFCTVVAASDLVCFQHVDFNDVYCFLDTRDITCLT